MSDRSGPAFPGVELLMGMGKTACAGLSKREWFAGMALNAVIRNYREMPPGISTAQNIAAAAFEMADSMLAESEKR